MKKNTQIFIWIPVILVIIAVLVLIYKGSHKEKPVLTGIVEVTEVDVSSKIPGRVDSVFVREGDHVSKGQLLATLQSREIDAKVEQARGAMDAAKAKLDMAHNGARPEEREAAEKMYFQAQHQFDLAEKTWTRIQEVYKDSVISQQERDQVEFQYKSAKEQLDAAHAKYEIVKQGARSEEVRAAEALFHQAENAYNEAMSYQQETKLVSPIDGEVSKRITDPGEMAAAGYPIMTLIDLQDNWVVIQVREDNMKMIHKDAVYTASIPSVGIDKVSFKVTYIASMADFATWRATSQKGEFDLKTFEVRLRPEKPISGLRAGMTVRVEL